MPHGKTGLLRRHASVAAAHAGDDGAAYVARAAVPPCPRRGSALMCTVLALLSLSQFAPLLTVSLHIRAAPSPPSAAPPFVRRSGRLPSPPSAPSLPRCHPCPAQSAPHLVQARRRAASSLLVLPARGPGAELAVGRPPATGPRQVASLGHPRPPPTSPAAHW